MVASCARRDQSVFEHGTIAAKASGNHEGNALVRHLLPKNAQEQGWVENEATVERVHESLSKQ